MPFSVIPAIDVSAGILVTWTADGPDPVAAFGGDPTTAASSLAEAGARWVHLVDVDHALTGSPIETATIGAVRGALPAEVRLQVSGGLETDDVPAVLAAGADRAVLGSRALADPRAATEAVARHGDGLVVGIEVADGRIRSRGRGPVDLELMESLGWLTAAGARGYLVTAVGRVGGSAGPDLGTIRRVVRAGRPVFAAGGISTLEHLRATRAAGAAGAVVGRAALDGTLDLGAATSWAAGA